MLENFVDCSPMKIVSCCTFYGYSSREDSIREATSLFREENPEYMITDAIYTTHAVGCDVNVYGIMPI